MDLRVITTIKKEKTMNTEFVLRQINTLVSDYNQIASDEITEKEKFQARYNDSITNEKLSEWKDGKTKAILSRLKSISGDIDAEITKESKKIPVAKFPFRFSIIESKKNLGELMRGNAFQFINLAKDKNSILNEIDSAFQTEQTDYGNNLIDLIELNKPNQIELSRASKEDREFYQAIENRKNDFELKHSLTNSNELLGKLELLKLELQFILSRIESKDATIIPIRKLLEIQSESDRRKFSGENLQAINISNEFFTKHNSISKYKSLLPF